MFVSHELRSGVVDLPRPGLPADRGLASLGLVMQLAGRASAAVVALLAATVVLGWQPHRHVGWFCAGVALCLWRSYMHVLAGRDLVYRRSSLDGTAPHPFDALRAYVLSGLGQAVAIGLVAVLALGATIPTAAGVVIALALWPATLAVLLRSRRDRRDPEVPLGEDRGLEGASIVMIVLGACGALSTGAIVLLLGGPRDLRHGWTAILLAMLVLLLVRSCMQVRAGVAGLRAASFDRPAELAARYASFGVMTAVCVGGLLVLTALATRCTPEAFTRMAMVSWLLVAWPAVIKRYYNDRQFDELLAGDRVIHRRAPDAGLTSLGWLLTGHAVLSASALILVATVEPAGPGGVLATLLELCGLIPRWGTGGLVLGAGVVGLELVAGVAVLRMSDQRRTIATIYALVAGAVALAVAWQMTRTLDRRDLDPWMAISLIAPVAQLVLPAATLVLVHRAIAPAARARYRSPPRS